MSEESAFLSHLQASPGDDFTRSVYADWLEERGDVRGEYLRREMELASIPQCDERHAALEEQLRRLRQGIAPEWLAQAGKRFDVVLFDLDPSRKISLIKRHRDRTLQPLWQGKRTMELLPSCLATALPRAEAEQERNAYRAGTDTDVELFETAYDAPAYAAYVAMDLSMQIIPAELVNSPADQQSNAAGWHRISELVGLPVEVLHTTNLVDRALLLRRGLTFAGAEAFRNAGQPHVRVVVQRLPPIEAIIGCELRWNDDRAYSVLVDHYAPEDRDLVLGVLHWLGHFPAEAEELVDQLPLTLAARDLFHAIRIWRRFRGKVPVRFAPRT